MQLIRIKIREAFEKSKVLNLTIQFLIITSIIHMAIDTLPDLSKDFIFWSDKVHKVYFFIFAFEYVLRFFSSYSPLRFASSFFGIVDLMSILPSIITYGSVDARSIRALRLIRVFRVLKLARYTDAMDRLKESILDIKEELAIFGILSLIVLFISSTGIYYFEREAQPEVFKSIPHSLWWSMVTLTTVGYGDSYPITTGGKVFTSILLILSMGILSVPTGLFASAFTKRNK
ncbi:MAG: ion transporter [Bacteriovoracaceae bacterium]|nr:ion transporter [Bacteriovoracaceae bacterium]